MEIAEEERTRKRRDVVTRGEERQIEREDEKQKQRKDNDDNDETNKKSGTRFSRG